MSESSPIKAVGHWRSNMHFVSFISLFSVLFCWDISLVFAQKHTIQEKELNPPSEFLLKNIIQMDEFFSRHVIVVEKSTHRLFIYKNNSGRPKLIAEFETATGEVPGDKQVEGDKKTPEGVYQLTRFFSSEKLHKMYGDYGKTYGAGAFELNYPNIIDRRLGKTGSGIWLHSTDDETRIAKGLDSRGCIVVNDTNLKEVSQYIDLNSQTPIIVTQNLEYWTKSNWTKKRIELLDFVESWRSSWKNNDLKKYLSHYHKQKFQDNQRRGFAHLKAHKSNVFRAAKDVQVNIDYVSIFLSNGSAIINMRQNYSSNLVSDTGKKTLYLLQNPDYTWSIIGETWSRINHQIADFKPQKYFID